MELDENRFGFAPQMELVYCRHLPYFLEHFDQESIAHLALIKSKLGESVLKRELRPAFVYWLDALSTYLKLYGFLFSLQDHLQLVRLLFEVCVDPKMDFRIVGRTAETLAALVKKKELLSIDDLVLDWKPLFALYERVTDNRYKQHRMIESLADTVRALVRACRVYFSLESTKQMLDLWSPLVCPFVKKSTHKAMTNFELFLPTEQHNRSLDLWLSEFLMFWQLFPTTPVWVNQLISLISRAAQESIDHIHWRPYPNLIFSRVLYVLRSPNGVDNDTLTSAVNLVTNMASGEFSSYEVVLDVLGSSTGLCNEGKNKFLSKLSECVGERQRRDGVRHMYDWDVERFVRRMMDCVLTSVFCETSRFDALSALKNLAALRPDIVIPPLVDRLNSTFDSSTESYRYTVAVECITSVLVDLVKGFATHLVPILCSCLPGIDPNDCAKSLVTLRLIERMISLVPVIDCSRVPRRHDNMTEVQWNVCLSTQHFEGFVRRFLDRCFVIIDAFSTETGEGSEEENLLQRTTVATFNTIINQCSPEMYEVAVSKLKSLVSARIFGRGAAAKMVAELCGATTNVDDPEVGLQVFLPPVLELLLEEISPEYDLDDEVLFNLLLLHELVSSNGNYLMQYSNDLLNVLNNTVWLPFHAGHDIACTALSNLLRSLSTIYVTEWRSLPWRPEDAPLVEPLPILHWGRSGDLYDLNVSWHVPSPEEVAFVQRLVDRFLVTALDQLNILCRIENMTRSHMRELNQNLNVAYRFLLGALPLCPKFQGPYDDGVNSSVEMTVIPCTVAVQNYAITINLANVREEVATTMRSLMHRLLDEDNTDAFKSIAKIFGLLVLYHGVMKEDHIRRFKEYSGTKNDLEDRLLGRKRHPRSVLLRRVQLQHERHVLQSGRIGMTGTVMTIFKMLITLSTSIDHEVRESSRSVLLDCLDYVPHSCNRVLPFVLPFFDGCHSEGQIEGALHLVIGVIERGLLTEDAWGTLPNLWLAILGIKNSSLSRLLDAAVAGIGKSLHVLAILYTVPQSALPLAGELCPIYLTPEEDEYSCRPSLLSKRNLQHYITLVSSLTALIENGSLCRRHYERCFKAMGYLVRHDVPLPAAAVRCLLNGTVHESLAVHESAVVSMVGVLRQQRHPPIQRQVQCEKRNERGFLTEYREDNTWLRYDGDFLCTDQLQWDGANFLHNHHIGFSSWPQSLEIYATAGQQPPLDRDWAVLTEVGADLLPRAIAAEAFVLQGEREVFNFFSDTETVDVFIRSLSRNDHNIDSQFRESNCKFFKCLFRNFGDVFLGNIVICLSVSNERCKAELISGLTRGCKLWPFDKVLELWERVLVPGWEAGLFNVTRETEAYWACAVNLSTSRRDPRSIYWLLQLLADGLPSPAHCRGSFREASRIHMMRIALENQSWRTVTFARRVLERVRPLLVHADRNVRKNVCGMLVAFGKLDVNFANARSPNLGGMACIVDWCIPHLQVFEQWMPFGGPHNPQWNDAVALLKTLSIWIRHYVNEGPEMKTRCLVRLVPLLMRGEVFGRDPDLQEECRKTLALINQSNWSERDLMSFAEHVLQIPILNSRRGVRTLLHFLRILVNSNVFAVMGISRFRWSLTAFVLKLVMDACVEIRKMAGEMLTVFRRCWVLDSYNLQVLYGMFKSRYWDRDLDPGNARLRLYMQHWFLVRRDSQMRDLEMTDPEMRDPVIWEFIMRDSVMREMVMRDNLMREKVMWDLEMGDLEIRDQVMMDPVMCRQAMRHTCVLFLCALFRADVYHQPFDTLVTMVGHLSDEPLVRDTVRAVLLDFQRTQPECWMRLRNRFTDDQWAMFAWELD